MFKVGDLVVDKNGRVFKILLIEEKNFGPKNEPYFVMSPFFDYDFNPGFQAFIPVAKSATLLRPVLNETDALALIDSINDLETYPDVSPRERKVYFTRVVSNGDFSDLLRVIKTLIEYREDRLRMNKPFSDFDRRLLNSLVNIIDCEFSLALSIPPNEVKYFILNRTGFSI